ncbi:MAG: Uma2 family endonuclease [Chloroflexi bacterium]|nr:Uma2 family endonuclease [Chloroflexota bacterium]
MPKVKEAKPKYTTTAVAAPPTRCTPTEYLKRERAAETKSEYYDGEIVAMAGASRTHNLIVGNLVAALHRQLEGKPCEVYPSDMRVLIDKKRAYVYPDVVVVCGKPEFADGYTDILVNPTIVIEVLSPSTHRHDRVKKFGLYRQLESLQTYVMVDSESRHVTCIERSADGKTWTIEMLDKLQDVVRPQAIGCVLPLRRVYRQVQFAS